MKQYGYDSNKSLDSGLLKQEQFNSIIRLSGNDFCADCDTKSPRWASVNLGILICIDCSGIHRSLGTHISVVKSLTLDCWTSTWIAVVGKVGNKLGRAYYEYDVPHRYKLPTFQNSFKELELWIRNKYDKKLYVPKNTFPPSYYVLRGEDPRLSIPETSEQLRKKHHEKSKLKRNVQLNLLDELGVESTPIAPTEKKLLSAKPEEFTDILQQLSSIDFATTIDQNAPNNSEPFWNLPNSKVAVSVSNELDRARANAASASIDQLFSTTDPPFDLSTAFPIITPTNNPPFPQLDSPKYGSEKVLENASVLASVVKQQHSSSNLFSDINPLLNFPTTNSTVFRTGFEDDNNAHIKNTEVIENPPSDNTFLFDFSHLDQTNNSKTLRDAKPIYTANQYPSQQNIFPDKVSQQSLTEIYQSTFDFDDFFSASNSKKSHER